MSLLYSRSRLLLLLKPGFNVNTLLEADHTDFQLIDAANAGDASAFDALYLRHRDWVVSLAFRITCDRALALDVLQDTFLYLVRKFPGFVLTCQLKSFLYPVVKNLALTARLKAKRYESHESLFLELEAPTHDDDSFGEALRHAIRTLPEAHREVLILRFMEEMTLAEIAEALDIPVGTAKSRLHHALDSLRSNPQTKSLLD